MKNKAVNILIGCCIMLSVGLNVYFLWRISSATKQISVFANQVVVVDDEIEKINIQLSTFKELENKVNTLQERLIEQDSAISVLTASLTEKEMEVARLESEVSEGKDIIESLEVQQQQVEQQQQQTQPQQEQQSQQPVNPMPTWSNGSDRNNSGAIEAGAGTYDAAIGSFGNYE